MITITFNPQNAEQVAILAWAAASAASFCSITILAAALAAA
jgi:hypothetical protein